MNNYIVDSLLTNEDIFLGKVKLMTIQVFTLFYVYYSHSSNGLLKSLLSVTTKFIKIATTLYYIYLFKERNTVTEKKKNKEILKKQR